MSLGGEEVGWIGARRAGCLMPVMSKKPSLVDTFSGRVDGVFLSAILILGLELSREDVRIAL